MKVDSVAASIYEITYQKVLSRTLSDELETNDPDHPLFLQYLDNDAGNALLAISNLLDKPDDPLWDRVDTPQKETRDQILLDSFNQALDELSKLLGDNMQDWTWGKIHQITPRHEFSSAQLVGGIFTLATAPVGGDHTTVSIGTYPLPYAGFPLQGPLPVTNHQSYRMILDSADWSRSVGVFATGESGQPGSKFRENMYPLWAAGDYLPMLYTSEQIGANKEGVLTLSP
jgi:penicillin amidase